MNAVELTKIVVDHMNTIQELERQVKYLTQELEKQRLIMDDMKIDIKDIQMMDGRK